METPDLSDATLLAEVLRLRVRNAELEAALMAREPMCVQRGSGGGDDEHAQLEALLAHSPVGLAFLDAELRFLRVNPALAALNQRPAAKHIGQTFGEVIPLVASHVEPGARHVLATGEPIHNFELRASPSPGVDLRDWLISYYPVGAPHDPVVGVCITVADVTPAKRVQAALRASEERFRLAVEHFPSTFVIYDPDLRIQFVNARGQAISGLPAAAIVGRRDDELFPPAVTAAYLPLLEAALASGEPQCAEISFVLPSGTHFSEVSYIPVTDETGRISQVLGITYNLTARKDAELALQGNQAKLQLALDAAGLGTWHYEASSQYVTLDARAAAHFGLSDGPQPTSLLRSRLHPDDGDLFEAALRAALDPDGAGRLFGEYRVLLADGALRWLAIHMRVTFTGAGPARRLAYSYGTTQDITERKRHEVALALNAEVLNRTNAELTRTLQLKDEFLAMMSHELRTPLSAILAMAEALDDGLYGPVNGRQHDAIDKLMQGGRHLLMILSDILDLAQIEAGKATLASQPLDLTTLCRTAFQFVQSAADQKGIRLLRTLMGGVEGLRGDERRLVQILVNLLDNAVKFTPEGGTVGLEVSADPRQEQIQFVIWDTGIGIAEADFERLFQPFTQVDGRLSRQYGGIGLGLTLVRRLVDLHGGSVSVVSTPGKGSRFTISLAWTEADNVAPTPARTPTLSLHLGARPPRVVVADDHDLTLQFYADLLRSQGCQVWTARTGVEAVAQVRAVQPHLALLDIQMPELDGLAAIGQLRADPLVGATPIIALTALAMPGDRERCLAAGANAYLAKPVSVRSLMTTIAEVLARAATGEADQ